MEVDNQTENKTKTQTGKQAERPCVQTPVRSGKVKTMKEETMRGRKQGQGGQSRTHIDMSQRPMSFCFAMWRDEKKHKVTK